MVVVGDVDLQEPWVMLAATAVDPKACDERVGVGRRLGAATESGGNGVWWSLVM